MLDSSKKVIFNEFENTVIKKAKRPPMPEITLLSGVNNPVDRAGFSAMYGRVFRNSLESGKSPFLPNAKDIVDFHPAYNIRRNQIIEGVTQIILKEKQAEKNYPTAAFVAYQSIKKAQENNVDCEIKKGEDAVVIPINSSETGIEVIRWYNVAQLNNSNNLVRFYKDAMEKDHIQRQIYLNRNRPGSEATNYACINLDKPNIAFRTFNKNNSSPEEYLAQVIAAGKHGIKLEVNKEIADAFVASTVNFLTAEYAPGKRNKYALFDLGKKLKFLTDKYSKAIIAERHAKRVQNYNSRSY